MTPITGTIAAPTLVLDPYGNGRTRWEDCRPDRYLLTYSPYLDMTHLRYYTPERLRELAETIRPGAVQVFPEMRVPLERLVRQEFRLPTRFHLLRPLYRLLFSFVTRRLVGPDWHIGLMVVIDLPGADGPPDRR